MAERVHCRKCGADLVKDQTVCPQCGERTVAGGQYHVEEEPPPWRPSPKMIKIAIAVVVVVVLVAVIVSSFDRSTPEEVAERWFGLLSSRSIIAAQDYVTPKLVQTLGTRMMSLTTLSEEFVTELEFNDSVHKFSKPVYQGQDQAEIVLTFTRPDKSPGPQMRLVLVRIDGEWKINQVL